MDQQNPAEGQEAPAPQAKMPFGMIVVLVYMMVSLVQTLTAAFRVPFLMLGPVVLSGTAAAVWNLAVAAVLGAAFWGIFRRRRSGRNIYIGYLVYQVLVPLSGYVTFVADRQRIIDAYASYAPQVAGLMQGKLFAAALIGTTLISAVIAAVITAYLLRRKDYFGAAAAAPND